MGHAGESLSVLRLVCGWKAYGIRPDMVRFGGGLWAVWGGRLSTQPAGGLSLRVAVPRCNEISWHRGAR